MIARLRERGWPHTVRYDRKRGLVWLGPQLGSWPIQHRYREWLTYPPEERTSAIDVLVSSAFGIGETLPAFEEARHNLLPLLRNSCDYELEARVTKLRSAIAPFAGPLSLLLAIDRPSSVRILSEGDLATWDQPFEVLRAIAVENLESRSPCRFERQDGGFYVSQFEDYYDASRLLLPRLFDQLDLSGAPVAVAMTRYSVAVAGRDDVAALNAMAAYVDDTLREATRAISYAPLILENGGWTPFVPTDRESAAVRALSRKQQIWDYGKQQEVLNAEPSGREVFVATADSSWQGDQLYTWSTWAKGVPTLLPRVDYLGVTDRKAHMFRRWDDIEDACGPFEIEAGHVPPRYFVDRWPDHAALSRLRRDFQPPEWGPD